MDEALAEMAKIESERYPESTYLTELKKVMLYLFGISFIIVLIIVIQLIVGIHIDTLEVLSMVVVLLVACIPIDINAVCTTIMALGSQKMAKEDAIVAKLASIEKMPA